MRCGGDPERDWRALEANFGVSLAGGKKRFGELRKLTPNATERMITLQLRKLEADGVVARHVYAEVPPRVEYEMTEFGRSLGPILQTMQAWGRAFKVRRSTEETAQQESEMSAEGAVG